MLKPITIQIADYYDQVFSRDDAKSPTEAIQEFKEAYPDQPESVWLVAEEVLELTLIINFSRCSTIQLRDTQNSLVSLLNTNVQEFHDA